MAQRSPIPRFGSLEKEDNVPYTACFEKAQKDRTGSRMNPNFPEGNPDLVLDNSSSNLPPTEPIVNSEDQTGKGSVRSTLELQKSKDDAVPKQSIDSPACHDNMGNRSGNDSTHRQGVGSADTRQKPARQSAGSEYSVERSPFHRLAKTPGRDSPSWEGGKNSYDGSHGTPGRSRLRTPNRGDESPDKAAAVPKFGAWDENDPSSADGYTQLFSKVRAERAGTGHAPGTPTQRPYDVRNQNTNDKAKSCCFGWCK